MAVSIAIPVYNHWELTHQLLLDIYKNFPPDTEVVVVNDCSTDSEVAKGLTWWFGGMLEGRMKIVTNTENVGFLRSSNTGVEYASHDIVFLINNDVRIHDKDVCGKLVSALNTEPSLVLAGARLLAGDTGWNKFGDVIFPYLEGWLLVFWKSEWLGFGGFDKRYTPYDFEDLDISTSYLSKGGKLVEAKVNAEHLGAQSYKYSPEREEQTKKNQKAFEEKWLK